MTDGEKQEAWLSGICEFTGPESKLPTGGQSAIPGWEPIKIAKRWEVLAAETDEGVAWKKAVELNKDDVIIGVEMNENSIKAAQASYPDTFYLLRDANNHLMSLEAWYKTFGTNGLGLMAMRQMRDRLNGKERKVFDIEKIQMGR
jgi:hypothetical protein